jgi:hypothetical protein
MLSLTILKVLFSRNEYFYKDPVKIPLSPKLPLSFLYFVLHMHRRLTGKVRPGYDSDQIQSLKF